MGIRLRTYGAGSRAWLGRILRAAGVAGVLCAGVVPAAQAQSLVDLHDFTRAGLDWYTIETEHFKVVFHHDGADQGSSRTARVVARIAEEIYEPITSLYRHEPDGKVTFVLKDFEDYSNGAAWFFDNKIEIWAPALDSPLRGDHNWLRNVITHEFTHIVQVQAAMKAGRGLPFLYVQYLGYEDVKRPDVLYGYPDVIATWPVMTLNNPAWLAEGTAQYQREFMHYDRWDSHRDMVLRTRVLAGEALTLTEMGGFYSHSSLLREAVYNQGFAFTQYLAAEYGEDILRRVTDELSRWPAWNVEKALRRATGRPAAEVYADWMGTLRREYEERTAPIRERLVEGDLIEAEGFSNFYPRFSPDGRHLAYVSNKGEHYNLSSLYILDRETGETMAHRLEGLGGVSAAAAGGASVGHASGGHHICSLGYAQKTKAGVSGTVTWHPEGDHLVYARTKTNAEGYLFSDLYRFDPQTKETDRLTYDLRAAAPAYSPDGSHIAFLGQSDGSANLYALDVASGEARRLTHRHDGTQASEPVWHPNGEWIYLTLSRGGGRDIYRVAVDGRDAEPEAVLVSDADERSPALDASGDWLYYASDRSGIFNIYRIRLNDEGGVADAAPQPLTNVTGGAFMPRLAPDGAMAFARYDAGGYRIAMLDRPAPVPAPAPYVPPEIAGKPAADPATIVSWAMPDAHTDADIRPFDGDAMLRARGAQEDEDAAPEDEADATAPEQVEKYSNVFTPLGFSPALRIDNYVSRRGRRLDARAPQRSVGGHLWRTAKFGVYVNSREILEEMSFFGGILVGPGSSEASGVGDFLAPSNLLKMERDAFVSISYNRGFRFLPKRWAPQFSVELYNIRRNVENGLRIEEFPCTACYPDTTHVDIAYSLWQGDIYARSKVNKALLLEVGYRYSPYRVATERFFSKEENGYVPGSGSRYFIGRAFTAGVRFQTRKLHRHSNVLPRRLRADLQYEMESGRLLQRFDVEDGALVPSYEGGRNHRLTLDARAGFRLPGLHESRSHGLGFRFRASGILGGAVDDFYNDYAGGLLRARGYPFYSLGGNETLWLQAAYHFPIWPYASKQVLFAYFDKAYGRIYADAALAWSEGTPRLADLRRDIGVELRVGLGSFYLLPTAFFVSATYGLDAFTFEPDEDFLTADGNRFVHYGHELLWHVGLLFDFDL